MDAACKHLSWNSLCNTSATSALLDTHLASGILVCFIREEASWMMLQASPVESVPINRSSTYRLSFSSCTAWEGEQVAKWCFIVAFNKKGLEQLPKGTRRNPIWLTSSSRFQRNLCTSRSPGLTLIYKKAFSISAVMATFRRRNLKRISVRLLKKNKDQPPYSHLTTLHCSPWWKRQNRAHLGRHSCLTDDRPMRHEKRPDQYPSGPPQKLLHTEHQNLKKLHRDMLAEHEQLTKRCSTMQSKNEEYEFSVRASENFEELYKDLLVEHEQLKKKCSRLEFERETYALERLGSKNLKSCMKIYYSSTMNWRNSSTLCSLKKNNLTQIADKLAWKAAHVSNINLPILLLPLHLISCHCVWSAPLHIWLDSTMYKLSLSSSYSVPNHIFTKFRFVCLFWLCQLLWQMHIFQ